MFIDRKTEIKALERAVPTRGDAFFILYGRRRVGKTELLQHFFGGRPHLYYTGDLGTSAEHVAGVAERTGDAWLREGHIRDWRSLLQYLQHHEVATDLVLDEFPYLCDAEPALPSLLQKFWEDRPRPMRLVLCGSSVGFMEREVLGARSPLFGRRTGQMRLRPMDFWSAREFFPRYPAVRQVEAYACLGGMPAYLRQFNDERSIPENIREAILEATAYLHEEPRLLLQQELREPRNYFSILRSVAEGNTRLNDIVLDTGLERGTVGRYLDTLGGLDLVEREVPVTEADPSRSRRGQYRLVDPFMRFWFRYVHRYRTEIESGTQDELLARVVLPDLGHLVAPIFEELCRAWLLRRSVHGDLPIRLKKVGRWWNAASEIDVVGLSDEGVVLGECKWSEHPVGPKVLADLQARPFPTDMPRHYVLFSRAGFHGLKPMPGLTLVDLEALVEDRMPVR